MSRDKAIATEQSLAGLAPGPWTAFNPLNPGWSLGSGGYAYARYQPADNSVELLFSVSVNSDATSGQVGDGYQFATMPAADSDGTPLLPPQTGYVPVMTDHFQSSTPGSPRVHVNPGGAMTIFGISTSSTWMRCGCGRYTMDDLGLS